MIVYYEIHRLKWWNECYFFKVSWVLWSKQLSFHQNEIYCSYSMCNNKDGFHILSYHVTFFPHITFVYYKNIQIHCINFSIVISKIHIGFSSENRLAESNYSIAINPLFANRVFRTHGWNILKACNFTAKRKQFQFQCRFKERNWLNFFFRTLKRYSR